MKLNVMILAVLLLAGFARSAGAEPAEDFGHWLDGVRREATAQGVPVSVVDSALGRLEPLPRVLELDQKQPETTISFSQYIARVLVPERISEGRRLRAEEHARLRAVANRYGVSPKTIMALWAIESSYGKAMGNFRIVDALATLAYDGRRPDLFRAELIAALKILGKGRFESGDLKGSWAGAMGQCQFMPSTYLKYAVAEGHEGQPDIWRQRGDVFASAANYLSAIGWKRDETWGREVLLPARFDAGLLGLPNRKSLAEWARLGVRRRDGGKLPSGTVDASVVAPDGVGGRAFVVYDNFRTIMKWNHSTYFALAVGLLGDAIGN
jgi:membrane-bound lytic murein transglycosylase B